MFRRSSPRPAARAVRAAPSLRGGRREATDEAVLGPRPERSAPLRHCEEAIEKRPTKQSSVRDPSGSRPPRHCEAAVEKRPTKQSSVRDPGGPRRSVTARRPSRSGRRSSPRSATRASTHPRDAVVTPHAPYAAVGLRRLRLSQVRPLLVRAALRDPGKVGRRPQHAAGSSPPLRDCSRERVRVPRGSRSPRTGSRPAE
jgi:hypothetical protein